MVQESRGLRAAALWAGIGAATGCATAHPSKRKDSRTASTQAAVHCPHLLAAVFACVFLMFSAFYVPQHF